MQLQLLSRSLEMVRLPRKLELNHHQKVIALRQIRQALHLKEQHPRLQQMGAHNLLHKGQLQALHLQITPQHQLKLMLMHRRLELMMLQMLLQHRQRPVF